MLKKHALILTAGQGHLSIGLAVTDILTQSGWRCSMVKEISRFSSPFWEAYNLFYRYAPHLFGSIFELGQQPLIMGTGKLFMLFINAHKIVGELLVSRPDVIISTHFGYNPFLEVVAKTTSIPIINVVSDPRTIHPMIVMPPPAINLVFDQSAAQYVKRLKPEAKVIVSGWFVRPNFYQLPAKAKIRRTLRIKPDKFVVTFVTGSTGTTSVLPLIKLVAKKMQHGYLIVVCGNNARLKKSLSEIVPHPTTKLKLIGFTHQVGGLMRVADLVVGKAGPNMLFEAVAVKVPFLASTYISGQESGNIEIIKKNQLGWVQTVPARASAQILNLQKNPDLLTGSKRQIATLAKHNQASGKILLELVDRLTKHTTIKHRFKLSDARRILPRFISPDLH